MKKLAKKITSLFLAFFLLTTVLPQFIPAQKFTVEASTLRSTIVSYMRSMATIKWTPKTTMNYWTQDGRKWYAGTTYTGIPYTQYGRYTNLATFKSYLNSSNVYTGPTSYADYRGNDCSSAVAYAWRSVDSSYPVQSTHYMMPSTNDAKKVVKVGSWTDTGNSETSCTSTGKTKMYAAYDQLLPGDAINDSASHIRLVVSVNPAAQTVKCIEQASYKSGSTTSWKVDVNYTYANLYSNGYVPIRLKMLQNDVVSYTLPAQFQVTASTLNVRSGPSTSDSILGELANGAIVTVSAISNDWATITYNGSTAYVSATYLSYYGPASGGSTSGGSTSGGSSSSGTVKTGDMVTLSDDAVWTSGSAVASWCLNGFQFQVGTVTGNTCLLLNPEADYGVTGEIDVKYLTVVGSNSGGTSGGTSGGSSGGTTTTSGLNGYSPSGPGNGLSVYGIDVSYFQGDINWSNVAASGKKFAIIRIGYTYSVDKSLVQDPKFVEYYSGATAAGLDVGVYYYSRATTTAKALEEAKQVMTWLDGRVLDYPIYIDMEADEQASSSLKSSNAQVVKTFCDYVHSQGYLAGMYSGEWFTDPYVDMSVITPSYETWTSNYSGLSHQYYNGSYGMFQYSSSGSVSGISGNVDLDVCYKDYPAIMEKYGLSGHKSSSTTTTEGLPDAYQCTSDSLKMYSDASSSSTVVQTIEDSGSLMFTVTAIKDNYAYYTYNGLSGYSSLSNLKSVGKVKDNPVFETSYGNHRYRVYKLSDLGTYDSKYKSARKWCEYYGGHVATYTSTEEWKATKAMLAEDADNRIAFIGGRYDTSWYWQNTGEEWWSKWATNEPGSKNFIVATTNGWHDATKNGDAGLAFDAPYFICEFEPLEVSAGLGGTANMNYWSANRVEKSKDVDEGETVSSGSFDSSGNWSGSSVYLNSADYPVVLTATPNTGYDFDGWTINGNYTLVSGTLADTTVKIIPLANIDASAAFSAVSSNSHVINYYVDGALYDSVVCETGNAVTALEAPSKTGYTFSGWEGLPATMPDKDVTVTGTFTPNTTTEGLPDAYQCKTDSLIMYKNASSSSTQLQTISSASGIMLTVTAISGDYAYYTYNGMSGYSPLSSLKLAGLDLKLNPVTKFNYNNHRYFLYKISDLGYAGTNSYSAARKWCEYFGGHLATYISAAEWNATKTVLAQDSANRVAYIGGKYTTSTGWYWLTTGEDWWSAWATNEPGSNLCTAATSSGWYDCTFAGTTGSTNSAAYFLCEYEPVGVTANAGGTVNMQYYTTAFELTSENVKEGATMYSTYCAYLNSNNYPVTLTAKPNTGYELTGWTFGGNYEIISGELTDTTITIKPMSNFVATAGYAKVSTASYNINYYVDGALYQTVTYNEGATVTALAAPSKTGYTFSGWNNLPATMPNSDVTVTGEFIPNNYTITYVIDDAIYSTVVYPCDAAVTALAAPIKAGYKFSGWSNLPETMPAKDIIVTGSFEKLTEYECGDCNMDGVVNVRDATLIQFYLANDTALSDEVEWLCDFNNDGVVNVIDATDLQKSIVGII